MQNHTLLWFRLDLRLADNAALQAALATGLPVLPVFILDDDAAGTWAAGGAARWWLHQSLVALDKDLRARGSRLLFYKGCAAEILPELCRKYRIESAFWNRRYESWAQKRDTEIKKTLKDSGVKAESFSGYLLFEPWEIKNASGAPYRVFTPFSKACMAQERETGGGLFAAPEKMAIPEKWPEDHGVDALGLMPRIKWYGEMQNVWLPGESGALRRWRHFLDGGVTLYGENRDLPAEDGVSRLSPHLHWGEIAPARLRYDLAQKSAKEPQNHGRYFAFLRQILWREFSWHLLYHMPDLPENPLNPAFSRMEWENDAALLQKWQKGLTGYPLVDAGMRQLWRTGWMHNRVRMIAASFLIKDLLIDWRKGQEWFWETLVDADLANNAAGWQWVAGCGADAAPYFRIFNPVLQSKKFDAKGAYIRQYVPELARMPDAHIHAPWQASAEVLAAAGVVLGRDYPFPVVDHAVARNRALEIYQKRVKGGAA
ncbi:MAG: deoxyribodipyrimidine photo-lyase [Micavibrio sp.]|nr:MAG: deoxyribodipyrimidine photo-lyase [Micavibrio sp.]